MEVLCACDGPYLAHAATMLCSLLEHNRISRIHLFYSSVSKPELEKLETFVSRYRAEIVFYEMALSDFEGLHIDKWASAAVYFRLLAPRFLPADLDKILYLDTDLIVRQSLLDLWNTKIENFALAAVPHNEDEDHFAKALGLPDGCKYFNSGVLLINLRFWRENSVVDKAITFVRENPDKVQFWDQDALNATLVGKWIELPTMWNWREWIRPPEREARTGPSIVHFAGHSKPWQWGNRNPYKGEYRKYRDKTPWQYREENRPDLHRRLTHSVRESSEKFLRLGVRRMVPSGVRRWLKSRLYNSALKTD
jgi:lipopolysaccharide biosynthesis glycosyltransferase